MPHKAPEKPGNDASQEDRERRLADALRANLRRRKAGNQKSPPKAPDRPDPAGT